MGEAVRVLAPQFRAIPTERRRSKAENFIEEEEADSGIIVSRGAAIRFWHLTFQEFLAARTIAGMSERDQLSIMFADHALYRAEWREVILLLAGILLVRQGPAKVDQLFQAILDDLGREALLHRQVQCAGLLGRILADLRPLEYRPPDGRYRDVLEAVLVIFDKDKAVRVSLSDRLDVAEALGLAGDPRLKGDIWAVIPGGEFNPSVQRPFYRMQARDPDDEALPEGPVALQPYEICRHPVTVEDYQSFIEDGGYHNPALWTAGGYGSEREPRKWDGQLLHPNRPVTSVSWYEASAYCRWARVRLPSAVEWVRAATGAAGRPYPWGDALPTPLYANYAETRIGGPAPVGLFPHGATPEGIYDLAGNVWEWVSDQHPGGVLRLLFGGSCSTDADALGSSTAIRDLPVARDSTYGFRCVRESRQHKAG